MLKELTKYSSFGDPRQAAEILSATLMGPCSISSLKAVIHSYSARLPRVDEALALLTELNLCCLEDGQVSISEPTALQGLNSCELVEFIAHRLMAAILREGLFDLSCIHFNRVVSQYYLTASPLPLAYFSIRCFLEESGVLTYRENRFYIEDKFLRDFENAEAYCAEGLTPEQLLKKLEADRVVGDEAERFVMRYEFNRLGESIGARIKRVSLVSTAAGYDIASFDSPVSLVHDRFIEVKAISKNGFYLSRNEVDTAKELEGRYYLYLVDVSKAMDDSYEPIKIADPISFLNKTADWFVEPDSYRVRKVFSDE